MKRTRLETGVLVCWSAVASDGTPSSEAHPTARTMSHARLYRSSQSSSVADDTFCKLRSRSEHPRREVKEREVAPERDKGCPILEHDEEDDSGDDVEHGEELQRRLCQVQSGRDEGVGQPTKATSAERRSQRGLCGGMPLSGFFWTRMSTAAALRRGKVKGGRGRR